MELQGSHAAVPEAVGHTEFSTTALARLLASGMRDELLAIAATMGASLRNLVIALAILTTPAFVRLARANTMVFANREFIRAARGLGASHRRILTRELLPNVALPVASYAFVLIAVVLVAEGSLSFLFGLLEQADELFDVRLVEDSAFTTL